MKKDLPFWGDIGTAVVALCVALAALAAPASRAQSAKEVSKQMARDFFDRECKVVKKSGSLTLARDGEAQVVIVAPEGAAPAVVFAAKELKAYLDRIAGADFKIVSAAPADGRAIFLGDGPQARAAGIDVDDLARDGSRIVIGDKSIVIAGKDDATDKAGLLLTFLDERLPESARRPVAYGKLGEAVWDFERGTLYGAYRFLEELGVRWFLPGAKGEIVPEAATLAIDRADIQEEPAFALRCVGRSVWIPGVMGRFRKNFNREEFADLGLDGEETRLWLLRMRGSSQWFAFNHRVGSNELPERFGDSHPEYFALLENGKRDLPKNSKRRHDTHLCYTSEGMFEETMKDLEAFFTGQSAASRGLKNTEVNLQMAPDNRGWRHTVMYGDTATMLPGDGFRACLCDDCRPLQHPDLEYWRRNTDLVWQFVTRVAREVERRFPGKIVICLAYSSYTEIPPNVKNFPDNLVVGICPKVLNKTYNIQDDKSYGRVIDLVSRWSEMNDMPLLFWFHHLYRHAQPAHDGVPMMIPRFWGKFFPDLSRYGRMMYMQLDSDSIMYEHLNRYVMMRLLIDPTRDVEALLDDYYEKFYGPAAAPMRALLTDMEKRCTELAAGRLGRVQAWDDFFNAATLADYDARIAEAKKLAAGTPYAEPVRLVEAYLLGDMKAGRAQYVEKTKSVAEKADMDIPMTPTTDKAIAVDGDLSEAAWGQAKAYPFFNNIDGARTQYDTTVRVLYSDDALYVGFTCPDPKTRSLGDKSGDNVEIFLDPEHDHQSYYQMLIDLDGHVRDWYYEGGGEPADESWESEVEVGVKRAEDRWTMEVRVPRKNLEGGLDTPKKGEAWGANFCRTMSAPPRGKDTYSCFSPIIRGGFHQPDLFGQIVFK